MPQTDRCRPIPVTFKALIKTRADCLSWRFGRSHPVSNVVSVQFFYLILMSMKPFPVLKPAINNAPRVAHSHRQRRRDNAHPNVNRTALRGVPRQSFDRMPAVTRALVLDVCGTIRLHFGTSQTGFDVPRSRTFARRCSISLTRMIPQNA